MGLGQTLLTIMALMLMGRVILSMNSSTLEAGFTKDMAEYRISGTSIGTSMLEKANGLAFDEATVDGIVPASAIANLTAPADFGPDGSEVMPDSSDDIDDYHGYISIDTLNNGVVYKTTVSIEYISATSTSMTTTTSKTFSKRISVEVTSDYLIDYSLDPPKPDTLHFQSIFSYWYFR